MFIVQYRKIFYAFSLAITAFSVFAMIQWGFAFGIDFKGGSSVEFVYTDERPTTEMVRAQIDSLAFEPSIKDTYTLVPAGEKGYVLNLRTVTEEERTALIQALSAHRGDEFQIKKFNSVGPTLGREAATKSLISIVLVIFSIMVFLTFAFRKVSEPVSSWKYGVVSVVTLLHDVMIPLGAFSVLNHFIGGYQIDTLFITAILVILGFSIHDTIVVFDRIRENLRESQGGKHIHNFPEIVGASVSQTFVRSINTSATTLLAILAVYLVGPEATKHFSLALFIGILFGTYSSIFIGSNLLVTWEKYSQKRS